MSLMNRWIVITEYHHALFKTYSKLEANFIITSSEILCHILFMVAEQT